MRIEITGLVNTYLPYPSQSHWRLFQWGFILVQQVNKCLLRNCSSGFLCPLASEEHGSGHCLVSSHTLSLCCLALWRAVSCALGLPGQGKTPFPCIWFTWHSTNQPGPGKQPAFLLALQPATLNKMQPPYPANKERKQMPSATHIVNLPWFASTT